MSGKRKPKQLLRNDAQRVIRSESPLRHHRTHSSQDGLLERPALPQAQSKDDTFSRRVAARLKGFVKRPPCSDEHPEHRQNDTTSEKPRDVAPHRLHRSNAIKEPKAGSKKRRSLLAHRTTQVLQGVPSSIKRLSARGNGTRVEEKPLPRLPQNAQVESQSSRARKGRFIEALESAPVTMLPDRHFQSRPFPGYENDLVRLHHGPQRRAMTVAMVPRRAPLDHVLGEDWDTCSGEPFEAS